MIVFSSIVIHNLKESYSIFFVIPKSIPGNHMFPGIDYFYANQRMLFFDSASPNIFL